MTQKCPERKARGIFVLAEKSKRAKVTLFPIKKGCFFETRLAQFAENLRKQQKELAKNGDLRYILGCENRFETTIRFERKGWN